MLVLQKQNVFLKGLFKSVCLMFFVLFLAGVPTRAQADDDKLPIGTVYFERLLGGQYIIKAHINGQGPFRFMIDTGATRTSIFETTRKALGLEIYGSRQRNISGMTSMELRPVIHIDSLSFATVKFEDHDIIVLEDWPKQEVPSETIDGILGMDVLDDLILSFKHKNQKLKIKQHGKINPRSMKRWAKFNLTANPYPGKDFGLMFTNTRFGDLLIPTMFDTGADFTAVSWNIVEGGKLGKEKRRLRDEWVVQGAVGEFKPKMRIVLDKFIVDGFLFRRQTLLIMDFDKLPINGYGQYPMVIAGVDLLDGHDFILDMKEWDLYVNAPLRKQRVRGGMRARSEIDAMTVIVP